jgi:small subunit ribosomal protein S5
MRREEKKDLEEWRPVTKLGKQVKKGEVTDINKVLDNNIIIREPEITETLIPNLSSDLLLVGQAKGKFGGGQRRVFRVTQKKTRDGNKPKFLCTAIVGNQDGIIGLGMGHAGETVPARNKSLINAKKNIFKIKRGCGSWECGCGQPHSLPFAVTGKCSSVKITLYPAPKGIGLCVNDECKKILKLAGVEDVWSKTEGQTGSRMNLVKACMRALRKLNKYHLNPKFAKNVSIIDGGVK